MTLNGALTIHNSRPSSLFAPRLLTDGKFNRLRDFQFAGQIDLPLVEGTNFLDLTLSAGGRFQRLASDAFSEAALLVPQTRGNLGIGLVKLTFSVPGTDIEIPIAFSYASRTELDRGGEARANFGFTYNFDSLFTRLSRPR